MRNKVLLDTCVLVSSSVLISGLEDFGVKEIKHPFFDQSTRLVSLLRKHLTKRLGITTTTIESEAYSVLDKAVITELRKEVMDRRILFEILSIVLNQCEKRLREILSFLIREPIDPVERARRYVVVNNMYARLREFATSLPKPAALMAEAVPKKLRRAIDWFEFYKTQDEILNAQLYNLLYKDVEEEDKIILSEAVYLLNLYKQTEGEVTLFLVSTDHHFSPVRRMRWVIESRRITDEIYANFGIICDWPHEIHQELSKRLE